MGNKDPKGFWDGKALNAAFAVEHTVMGILLDIRSAARGDASKLVSAREATDRLPDLVVELQKALGGPRSAD